MDIKRILIADEHPLFHEALKGVALDVFAGHADCTCTTNVRQTMEALDKNSDFDLILLDLKLPGAEGFSCLMSIRSRVPSVPVVIVSSTDHVDVVRESFSYGAMGYLPKSSSQEVMKNAIRLVMSGSTYIPTEALGSFVMPSSHKQEFMITSDDEIQNNRSDLTPRQLAVLGLLAEGKANKIIA